MNLNHLVRLQIINLNNNPVVVIGSKSVMGSNMDELEANVRNEGYYLFDRVGNALYLIKEEFKHLYMEG